MSSGLAVDDVRSLLEKLRRSAIREECWSCDCFQGFITQLELDAADDVKNLTDCMKVTHDEMHGCLGCDPCPPAVVFAEYLSRKNTSQKDTR